MELRIVRFRFINLLDGKAPGCELSHLVDSRLEPPSLTGNIRYGPEAIVHYLAENHVFVDLWDGDSLLHIGVCAIPLRALLRQGRSAVTIDEDVDIIWTEVRALDLF